MASKEPVKVLGISPSADRQEHHERIILVTLSKKPTDDQLRKLHDHLKNWHDPDEWDFTQ